MAKISRGNPFTALLRYADDDEEAVAVEKLPLKIKLPSSRLPSKPPPEIKPREQKNVPPYRRRTPYGAVEEETKSRLILKIPVIKPAAKGGYRWVSETPSSSSPIHNRVVCFRIEADDGWGCITSRFYFVDVNFLLTTRPPPEAILFHHLPISRKPPYRSNPIPVCRCPTSSPDIPPHVSSSLATCAYVKPNLFILGGADGEGSSTAEVYRLDVSLLSSKFYQPFTLFPKSAWKTCSRMTCPIPCPQAVVVDQHIYVLGWGARVAEDKNLKTTSSKKKNAAAVLPPMPFVQVYDAATDQWDPVVVGNLRFDSVEPILGVLSHDPDHSKHILFQPSCEDDLYTYSLADKTLSHHHMLSPFHNVHTESVVIDGIHYSYQQCNNADDDAIVGYSLHNHRWVPIPVLGLSPHLTLPLAEVHLVGLGDGMLCVVWTDSEPYSRRKNGEVTVFMTTFKMFKLERNPHTLGRNEPLILLQASHISSRGFLVPGMYPLLNCLVLELPDQPSSASDPRDPEGGAEAVSKNH